MTVYPLSIFLNFMTMPDEKSREQGGTPIHISINLLETKACNSGATLLARVSWLSKMRIDCTVLSLCYTSVRLTLKHYFLLG